MTIPSAHSVRIFRLDTRTVLGNGMFFMTSPVWLFRNGKMSSEGDS
jgi:hypothetical protein